MPRRFCVHITSRKIPFTKNYNNHEMTLAASVTGESDTACHVRTKTAAKKEAQACIKLKYIHGASYKSKVQYWNNMVQIQGTKVYSTVKCRCPKGQQINTGLISTNEGVNIPMLCYLPEMKYPDWMLKTLSQLTAWLHYHNRHHHRGRVAGEGRRVVAPPCPRSTARL